MLELPPPMPGRAIFDEAVVDSLQPILERATAIHIVGALADGARARLARSVTGTLSIAETPGPPGNRSDAVVVLDLNRLGEGEAMVEPRGTLAVAAANPRYAPILLEALEGRGHPWPESVGLDGICRRLEAAGWEVEDAIPVIVPLALIPFDPARVPKTVLAYLYARQPDIETYCYLVRARQPVARPPLPRTWSHVAPAEYPTAPWKSESDWRQEVERLAGEREAAQHDLVAVKESLEEAEGARQALERDLAQRDDELSLIKSSLAWRTIEQFYRARGRMLPPDSRRGRWYARSRLALHRILDGRR
jgi:hypothetical protein